MDDYVIAIAEKGNVTRELGQVKKHGIVLEPTLPTDSVLWNKKDERFQM